MWDHTVQAGESLFIISQKFKKNLNEIFSLNPQIQDKNKIFPGMTVHMPDPPPQGDVIIGPITFNPSQTAGDPTNFREPLIPGPDYISDKDYIDNVTAGHYDFDNDNEKFTVDHADGSKIALDFEQILNDQKGGARGSRLSADQIARYEGMTGGKIVDTDIDATVTVFWRDKRNKKIYPSVFNKTTAPNIVYMVNDVDSVRSQGAPGMQIAKGIVDIVDWRLNSPLGMRAPGAILERAGGKAVVQGNKGTRIVLDEAKLKALVIEKWNIGGTNRLVKVVSKARGPLKDVGGYITQEKYIVGRTPAEMERLLGLQAGELKEGANVMSLNRLPKPNEFELRGYTNTPGGLPYQAGDAYPPGLGVPQWQIGRTVQIPATPVKFVAPGTTF